MCHPGPGGYPAAREAEAWQHNLGPITHFQPATQEDRRNFHKKCPDIAEFHNLPASQSCAVQQESDPVELGVELLSVKKNSLSFC